MFTDPSSNHCLAYSMAFSGIPKQGIYRLGLRVEDYVFRARDFRFRAAI